MPVSLFGITEVFTSPFGVGLQTPPLTAKVAGWHGSYGWLMAPITMLWAYYRKLMVRWRLSAYTPRPHMSLADFGRYSKQPYEPRGRTKSAAAIAGAALCVGKCIARSRYPNEIIRFEARLVRPLGLQAINDLCHSMVAVAIRFRITRHAQGDLLIDTNRSAVGRQ